MKPSTAREFKRLLAGATTRSFCLSCRRTAARTGSSAFDRQKNRAEVHEWSTAGDLRIVGHQSNSCSEEEELRKFTTVLPFPNAAILI